MFKQSLVLCSLLLLGSSCTSIYKVDVEAMNKKEDKVTIYFTEPEKKYTVKYSYLMYEGFSFPKNALNKLQKRATKDGCNAVIIKEKRISGGFHNIDAIGIKFI